MEFAKRLIKKYSVYFFIYIAFLFGIYYLFSQDLVNHIIATLAACVFGIGFPLVFMVHGYKEWMEYKASNDPNTMAYYSERYDISSKNKVFELLQDESLPEEHKDQLEAIYKFYNLINLK